MRFTEPLEITPARITSNPAPEPGVGEEVYNNATTYPARKRVIVGAPSNTVSISNSGTAAAAAFTGWAAHKMSDGAKVVLSTTGVLPVPLQPNVVYYAANTAADTFALAEFPGGTPISTTSAGSGTHTATNHVHRTFESLVDGNVGNAPTLAANIKVKWADVGPTNAWAWADLYKNTVTTYPSPYVLQVTPGVRIDTVGMGGLLADSVLVEALEGSTVVYSYNANLAYKLASDWREYFYGGFLQRTNAELFDLPLNSGLKVRLTFTRAAGPVGVGGVVFGLNDYIGITLAKPVDSAKSYSKVTTNDYGETTFVPRTRKQRYAGQIMVEQANWPKVRELRDRLDGKPFLISGMDDASHDYAAAVSFIGFYTILDGALDDPGPKLVTLNADLQEI